MDNNYASSYSVFTMLILLKIQICYDSLISTDGRIDCVPRKKINRSIREGRNSFSHTTVLYSETSAEQVSNVLSGGKLCTAARNTVVDNNCE